MIKPPKNNRTDQPSSRLASTQIFRDWSSQQIVSFAPGRQPSPPLRSTNYIHCGKITLVCKQQPPYTGRTRIKRFLDARYKNMKWNLIIAAVTCLVTGCSESVRREPIQPDDILSQEFRTIFRAQGYTNRLDFMHVTRTTRRGRIEYDVMARDLEQPELAGGPSLTITRNGTNWVVVAAGSWQP